MGCRTTKPASELVRLRLTDDAVAADPRAGGRGAWLCRASAPSGVATRCLDAAVSSRAFDRAFRHRVAPHLIEDLVRRMSLSSDGGRPQNRR